jgi:hypothetical protein
MNKRQYAVRSWQRERLGIVKLLSASPVKSAEAEKNIEVPLFATGITKLTYNS